MQNVPNIVRERLRAVVPPGDHPEADLLTAFAEQSLPERERAKLMNHLARCGQCRDVIMLALPAAEETRTVTTPVRGNWLTWPTLRWAFVAAGIIAIASFAVMQYQHGKQNATTALRTASPEATSTVSKNEAPAPPAALDATALSASAAKKSASADLPQSSPPPPAAHADAEKTLVAHLDASYGTTARAQANEPKRGAVAGGPLVRPQQQGSFQLQAQAPSPAAPRLEKQMSQLAANVRSAPSTSVEPQAGGLADAGAVSSDKAVETAEVFKAKDASPPATGANEVKADRKQTAAGQIGGYVFDPSGAVVQHAQITVTPANAGPATTTVTDARGSWEIAGLTPGNYRAQAQAQGFRTSVLDFSYDAKNPAIYSMTLAPGSVTETVEVAAAAPVIQTETSAVGKITSKETSQLPLNGRNVTQLATMTTPRWTISSSGGLQRSLDQGKTWQDVNVLAESDASTAASSLEVSSETTVARAKVAQKKSASAPFAFRAVTAIGADVWAGGSQGALYHSSDAGNHWTRVVPSAGGTSLTGDVIHLQFADAQHGKITTSRPEVWTTSDGGQTWQKN